MKFKRPTDRTIIILTSISFLLLGVLGGYLIKYNSHSNNNHNLNVDNYYEDIDKCLNKYKKYKGSNYLKDFTPSEIINIANYLYDSSEYSYCLSEGEGHSLIVTQNILTCNIRNKNKYFVESLSKSSIISVCSRVYYDSSNDTLELYKGKLPKLKMPEYNKEEKEEYTKESYFDYMGVDITSAFNYIISSKSIMTSTVKEEKDSYIINVELDHQIAAYNYVKQMKNISNLKEYPSYEYLKLTYKTDKKLKLLEVKIDEKYYAKTKMGVGSSVNSLMTNKYYYTQIDIPDISERFEY